MDAGPLLRGIPSIVIEDTHLCCLVLGQKNGRAGLPGVGPETTRDVAQRTGDIPASWSADTVTGLKISPFEMPSQIEGHVGYGDRRGVLQR